MQSDTKELGAIFTWLGWIGGLLMLVLVFNKVLDTSSDYQLSIANINGQAVSEITLNQNRQGHYLLNAQVNGHPITFLIDSGATVTSIPMNLAKRLQLPKGIPFSVQTANGVATAYQTTLQELKLGNIVLSNVRASLNEGMQGNEALLGMNVLKHFELIQKNRQLIIRHTLQSTG